MPFTAKIYVAGPYSKGDPASNVHIAIQTANQLADLGFAPYVPHFTHFWHIEFPRPYHFWLDLDNQFLPCCDAVLRIPGESSGADKEVELAKQQDMPVFYSIEELKAYYAKQ